MPKRQIKRSVLEERGTHLAAICNRVSRDKRRDERSVAEQDADNAAACDDHGWPVGERYVDNDKSASRFATGGRPDWERLVVDLAARRYTVLVLWEVSRGTRELDVWARLLNMCRTEGVLIHITSHHETYDVRKARHWKTLADEGVDAAYSSEETSERIKRDVRLQAAKGLPTGKILYGYRREYDRSTGALLRQVRDDVPTAAFSWACYAPRAWVTVEIYTRAGIVDEIRRRFLEGGTEFEIAKSLNDRGIPTKEKRATGWWPEHIRAMIMRPSFAGMRVHQGKVIGDAAWPPLISKDDHYRLVALLTAPERKRSRVNAVVHLLSGIATCGVCAIPLRVGTLTSGNKTYLCRRRGVAAGKGYHMSCAASPLEAFVEEVVIARLSRSDAADLFTRDEASGDWMGDLLARVAADRARLQGFYDEAAKGEITPAGLAAVEKRLLPEIAAAEERLKQMTVAPFVGNLVGLSRVEVEDEWDRMGLPQKRDVIRAVTEKIEVMPVGKAQMRPRIEESVRITWRT